MRKNFSNCLPQTSTIRKWYSSVDGTPGYTVEALNAIKIKIEEMRSKNQELVCCLMMDEMSIIEHIHWNGQRMVGYVNYGTFVDSDSLPRAKDVLVFMVVALNHKWKILVGYFLLNGLTAEQRANLLIFDVLNSRNFLSRQSYKRPISLQNKQFLFNFIDDSIKYLVSLRDIKKESLIYSNRKVGFLGLILSLISEKPLL